MGDQQAYAPGAQCLKLPITITPNLPPKYLPRSERYDHQKGDMKFEVMRGRDNCASDMGQTVVYDAYSI